jgi:hypothetical protein
MFGLDDQLATLAHGEVFAVVALIAVLLGLRHATDPDHLTAVTTLLAGDRPDARRAGRLGLSWGIGHATSLFAFGVPIVLFGASLPDGFQAAAELAVGVMIMLLALRVLRRWHGGRLDTHAQDAHGRVRGGRSGLQAYAIGLVHGMGGSAGVGVLLLAPLRDHAEALAALAVFAAFTALSMAMASTTFGFALSRGSAQRRYVAVTPALGALSLLFGLWYALGALHTVPYVL